MKILVIGHRHRSWLVALAMTMLLVCAKPGVAAAGSKIAPTPSAKPAKTTPPSVAVKINPKDGAEMILIPAGQFEMGSRKAGMGDEKPHTVMLSNYYIYKYDVTVAQYRKFCDASGFKYDWNLRKPDYGWHDNFPMVNVDWDEANAYATWAGCALPTEAEWEKAARGTDGRVFPWGDEFEETRCAYGENSLPGGKFNPNGHYGPWPVGSFPAGASPYGVMDMAGLVWQWCSDWYDAGYYGASPEKDPAGPPTGNTHVQRGGSWGYFHGLGNTWFLRSASRARGSESGNFGFRCVSGSAAVRPAAPTLRPRTVASAGPGMTALGGADWNQWRGPNRNGVFEDNVKLADSWRPNGPALLWKSEEFPSKKDGAGNSSPVLAKGKVYAFATWNDKDAFICLDAATGKTLWKKSFPGHRSDQGIACTPCVVGGTLYQAGSGALYALNADTGDLRWSKTEGGGEVQGSVAVVDGVVLVPCRGGFDAKTGDHLWKWRGGTWSSPAIWRTKDAAGKPKDCLIFAPESTLDCINPLDGKVIWSSVKNENAATPSLSGDLCLLGCPTVLLRLSLTGATSLCSVNAGSDGKKYGNGGSSQTIYKDHLYTMQDAKLSCFDMTGKLLWDWTNNGAWNSHIIVNGKILSPFGDVPGKTLPGFGGVSMCAATPDKPKFYVAPLPHTEYAGLCYGEGKLVLREEGCIACYDLTKK